MSDAQKAALLKLLGDEDPSVYQTIRSTILGLGAPVREWLEPCRLSNDPLVRRRSLEILQCMGRQHHDHLFLGFCLTHQGNHLDLEEAIWSLALTAYPDINPLAYRALLDSYAGDLSRRIHSAKSGRAILEQFQDYFFERLGYSGNQQSYYEAANSYLNRVVDRRTGNPISLSILYLLVGRRLGLPIQGIGLPSHFICRYQSSTEEIYADPFNRGRLLSKQDCIRYLAENYTGYEEQFLMPVSSRRILLRVCANLHQIASQDANQGEITRFQRYLLALAQ